MPDHHAKPFLKWAGGKRQLIKQFEHHFPQELKSGKIKYYFEPFVGSGAVFIHIAQTYEIESAFLYDINEELILTYSVVKNDVEALIEALHQFDEAYQRQGESGRQELYYHIRQQFNLNRDFVRFDQYSPEWVLRAAQLIFLNKTCFNGLFRVNSKGAFNVPFGKYKHPCILDAENLRAVSRLLGCALIERASFTSLRHKVSDGSFVYLDPPYRPISKTSCFTAYSQYHFDEEEQRLLALLFKELARDGVKLMLSNSDPKNEDPGDNFFEELYREFIIHRVTATRAINSNASRRGKINELLIRNYEDVA